MRGRALLAAAVVAAIVFACLPGRDPSGHVHHVYVISSGPGIPGEALKPLVQRYVAKHGPPGRFVVKDAEPGQVMASVPRLLERLRAAAGTGNGERPLIALEPPYSVSKKRLRVEIESAFSGEERRDALRSVVPVLAVPGESSDPACRQLQDDVIYMLDNFGGIGLVTGPNAAQVLEACTADSR